jgi:hypothetical protein
VICGLPFLLFIGIYIYKGASSVLLDSLSYLTIVYSKLERTSTFRLLYLVIRQAPQIMWAGVCLSLLSLNIKKDRRNSFSFIIVFSGCFLIRIWESKSYFYQRFPLPVQKEWKEEFLKDMHTKRPKYIIAHYSNNSLAIEEKACFAPDFPELRNILDCYYSIDKTFGSWSVFKRKE